MIGDVEAGSPPETWPQIWLPLAQDPRPAALAYVVRGRGGDPRQLLDGVSRAVWTVDPRMKAFVPDTLERLTEIQRWRPRLMTGLLGIFASLALVLAATGIYAVLSFAVSRRAREIGIRMALGARRGDVVALVMRQGLGMVAVGIALGVLGAVVLSRLLESQLFGVTPRDPATYVGLSLFLAAVALIACWVPVRRATRVDPVVALSEE